MKKIINSEEAKRLIDQLGDEFALVQNPGYVHPQFEMYPLAAKSNGQLDRLIAAVMDMDGTTTTTEELCIHSLEYMIRRFSGMPSIKDWRGLDPEIDYPNIIGNSTTKHVEYLIHKYQNQFDGESVKKSFLEAAAWTIQEGKDQLRKEEVRANLKNLGFDLSNLPYELESSIKGSTNIDASKLSFNDLVRMGIDVYYARYHQILERIKKGESREVSIEVFGNEEKKLIEPMPAVSIFLPLVKGWLGDEAGTLADRLVREYEKKTGKELSGVDQNDLSKKLIALSNYFNNHPLKIAVVTSSIGYEAEIVLSEVFNVIRNEISEFPLSKKLKEQLFEKFASPQKFYDAIISASDSSEIRLKPHRDLYSIALHRIGVSCEQFEFVAGFEDSESGITAIRAAGIGLAVAVPFAQTSGHDLQAASNICEGGLAEVLIKYNCFLKFK